MASAYRLTQIHRKIDDQIRSELKRRFPSSIRLLRLKKLRLMIKDRLFGIARGRNLPRLTQMQAN